MNRQNAKGKAALPLRSIALIAIVSLFFAASPANSKTIWAAPVASNQPCGASRDNPCAVADAFGTADTGDNVRLLEGDYTNVGGIYINETIIIEPDGPDAVISFTAGQFEKPAFSYVFWIDSSSLKMSRLAFSSFELTPIKITGGSRSNVSLVDCTFRNNGPALSLGPVSGGAIYAEGGLSCIGCKFTGNTVTSTLDASGGGIGIRAPCNVSDFAIVIDSCEFESNFARASTNSAATAMGGAMSFHSVFRDPSSIDCPPDWDKPISLLIKHSRFSNNFASSTLSPSALVGGICSGGAVFINSDVLFSRLEIFNTTFDGNSVSSANGNEVGGISEGSAIAISVETEPKQPIVLNMLQVTNNAASLSASRALLGGITGGAVSIHGAFDLILHNSSFDLNIAKSISGVANGGAISLRWEQRKSSSQSLTATLTSSVFTRNSASGAAAYGGAVYSDHIFTEITMDSVQFHNNEAKSSKYPATGGAVAILNNQNDHLLNMKSLSVVGNSLWVPDADASYSASGGAFYIKLSCATAAATLSDVVFQDNTIVSNLTSKTAVVSLAGAGLYFEGHVNVLPSPVAPIALNIFDSKFSHNSLRGATWSQINLIGAGLAVVSSSDASTISSWLSNVSVTNNSVVCRSFSFCSGAGVHADSNVNLRAKDSLFSSNRILAFKGHASPSVNGAAVNAEGAFSASNCTFRGNYANGYATVGGAVVATQVDIDRSIFEDNSLAPGAGLALGAAISVSSSVFNKKTASIRSSHFVGNGVKDASSAPLHSGGGAISLSDLYSYVIANNTFERNTARAGGAIHISTGLYGDRPSEGQSIGNSFINNSATIGAAVFLDIGAAIQFNTESLDDLCERYSVARGNTATWGNLCSSYPHFIELGHDLPTVLWPGRKFDISTRLLDRYNATIFYPIAPISVLMHNSVESRNATVSAPSAEAEYLFEGLRVDSNASFETISFVLRFRPLYLERSLSLPISRCPPAYQERILDSGLAGCEPCSAGFYTLAEDMECKVCIEEGEESHVEEHSHGDEESHGCLSPPSPNDKELQHPQGVPSSLNWHISSGFYPSPSPVRPTQLLPCFNHHACRDIDCALITEDSTALHLNCSINCNITDIAYSCLCNEGYTDRLCSRCACNSVDSCYFSHGAEEHLCRKCTPLSSGILVSVAAFLLVAQILFLLFKQSAIAILLAEFVVTAILLFLGLAEWYLFDMVVATGLLFLINSTSADSGSHFALPTSAVKVLIFFVPTTMSVVPSALWPAFARNLMAKINSFTLRMSGLECLSPELFSSASGRLVFVMLVPAAFAAVVISGHLVAAGLQRLSFVRRLQRCQRCRGKAADDDFPEGSGSESDSPAVLPYSAVPHSSDADEPVQVHLDSDIINENRDAMVESAKHLSHRHHSKASLWDQLSFSVQFILFASQVELSNVVLETLKSCKRGYMRAYPWVPCSFENPEYKALTIIAAFFLCIYVIGLPIFWIGQIVFYRKRIANHDHTVENRIGFLYETYRPEVFWFESAWLLRRALISISVSLVTSGVFSSAAIVIVLLASLFIQRHVMPFLSKSANFLELASTACLLLSFSMGKLISHAEFERSEWETVFVQVTIWIINVGIVLGLLGAVLAPTLNRGLLRIKAVCSRKSSSRFEFA